MRRRTDGFGPVVEYLIASSAVAFKDEGAQFISLSGAPLARTEDFDPEPLDKLLDALGAALEPYYGFRSFSELLEEAQARRLLDLTRDEKSGGFILRLVPHEE